LKIIPVLIIFAALIVGPVSLSYYQAFAGGFEPESCEECEPFRMNCLASPQDPAVCNRLADQCLKDLMCLSPVGGEMINVDSSALILAGSQTTAAWILPVIVSAIGIGIVLARKF